MAPQLSTLAAAVAAAGLTSSMAAEPSCTAGLTFVGHSNKNYDGDYLLDWLFPSHRGGRRFGGPTAHTHVDREIASIGPYTISPGCLGLPADHCNDLDQRKSAGKWVLYSTTTPEAASVIDPKYATPNMVVGFCTSGCPPPSSPGGVNGASAWPATGSFETTWELTGEQGPQGNLTATISCCKRKPMPCDGYTKCPSHNTPLGVFSPGCAKDECCHFVYPKPIAVGGRCEPDPSKILTSCAHGESDEQSSSAEAVSNAELVV
eukprot:TRINITY_DN1587_c0_g1_i1.p1 TRINITY_DN1587_c0_g1~~TRINITY_DN1587_c0_g1_i1.p1  ORF type:complete len:284 (-),score=56.47 TRINITY_DN1587_c0_g1_i1:96-881(-)